METWYVMEDGSVGDPRDISSDEDGVLRHVDGRVVAYAPHGPRSCGVDAAAERAKAETAAKEATEKVKAEAAARSKGREAKSPEDREMKSADSETR